VTDLLANLEAADAAVQSSKTAAQVTKDMSAANLALWKATYVPPTPPPSSSNFWLSSAPLNQRIPANPAIDPNSTAILDVLFNAKLGNGGTVGGQGLYCNQPVWSFSLWLATAATPTVTVKLTVGNSYLGLTNSVVIPYDPSWTVTSDTDSTLVVLRTDTGDYYEFESFDPSTMSAHSVAKYNVLTQTGAAIPNNWVGCMTSLFGVDTPADVAAGVITHGAKVITPCNSSTFFSPASHSDGGTSGGPQPGSQIQLDPSLTIAECESISGVTLTAYQQMKVVQAQNYGLWVGDSGGAFACFAQANATFSIPVGGVVIPPQLIPHMRVLANHAYVGSA
jgi:hypothetical protein